MTLWPDGAVGVIDRADLAEDAPILGANAPPEWNASPVSLNNREERVNGRHEQDLSALGR
jgi:hypothetical protein